MADKQLIAVTLINREIKRLEKRIEKLEADLDFDRHFAELQQAQKDYEESFDKKGIYHEETIYYYKEMEAVRKLWSISSRKIDTLITKQREYEQQIEQLRYSAHYLERYQHDSYLLD